MNKLLYHKCKEVFNGMKFKVSLYRSGLQVTVLLVNRELVNGKWSFSDSYIQIIKPQPNDH